MNWRHENLWLFDTGERDHVVGLLRVGETPDMTILEKALIPFLAQLAPNNIGHAATERFLLAIRTGNPEFVETAWNGWTAAMSGHRMYHDLPREQATTRRRTKAMIEKRKEMVIIESVNKDDVVAEYARRKALKERGLRAAVAADFNISANTVKNIWNARDRTKYP